jgi:glycosyltransferase involved in cell wall biosynthesis
MTTNAAKVAVLMATYNGAKYVHAQIESLTENSTPFKLHWIDDHSSDNSREAVRAAARTTGVSLVEWHQPHRQGYPGTFFQLLEDVEADIYLFCDQDDIWQRGKIDAAVTNLMPDVGSPTLCFSDPLMFWEDDPGTFYRWSDMFSIRDRDALRGAAALLGSAAAGQAIALTRPLRDLYLGHKDIARAHAAFHSWWMYQLANATGTCRALYDVPTTLYRQHGSNVTVGIYSRSRGIARLSQKWQLQEKIRPMAARHARGFMLAAETLPKGAKLERMLKVAPTVATLDRRLSPGALFRLWRHGAIPRGAAPIMWLIASSLCSDIKSPVAEPVLA